MTTLRKYMDVVKAELDKSLLEAAGIPAFIAGANCASIGYFLPHCQFHGGNGTSLEGR